MGKAIIHHRLDVERIFMKTTVTRSENVGKFFQNCIADVPSMIETPKQCVPPKNTQESPQDIIMHLLSSNVRSCTCNTMQQRIGGV